MAATRYAGPERRRTHRREQTERRQMIRFEPNNPPRRSGRDRRRHGAGVWEGRDRF